MAQQIIDLEISSPGAAPGAANMKPIESIAFSYGRNSLPKIEASKEGFPQLFVEYHGKWPGAV